MKLPLPLAFAGSLTVLLLCGAIAPQAQSQDGVLGLNRGVLRVPVPQTRDAEQAAASRQVPPANAPAGRAQPLSDEVTIVYEDGTLALGEDSTRGLGLWQLVNPDFQYANLYSVPEGLALSSVAVAPFYDSVFEASDAPLDAPRDFTLKVWDAVVEVSRATGEEMLVPGGELFSLVVADSVRSYPPDIPELDFLYLDLTAYEDELSDLPAEIFIGLANAGEDENYIALGVSEYDEENVSYVYFPGNENPVWLPFPLITNQGVNILESRVLPIRPTFRTPTTGGTGEPVAVDEGEELPERTELLPNYPNPFNPATTLAYRLPQTSAVRLEVYDVLGRRVATLLDGVMQEAGSHTFTLDASSWASGLYFYTLEAANQRLTRTMMLMK